MPDLPSNQSSAVTAGNGIELTFTENEGDYWDISIGTDAAFTAESLNINSGVFVVNSLGVVSLVSNQWHTSTDGKERFYLATNGTTYIKGHDGTTPIALRNASDANVVEISATGDIAQVAAGTYHEFKENGTTDAAAGAANTARLYCRDNGAGKSQLVVRFNSGAVQVLATEP